MKHEEVQAVAQAAAREAVREMLLTLGIDASNPEAIIEMQKDFQVIRTWRQSSEAVQRQGILIAVGVLVVGFLGMIYAHFRP